MFGLSKPLNYSPHLFNLMILLFFNHYNLQKFLVIHLHKSKHPWLYIVTAVYVGVVNFNVLVFKTYWVLLCKFTETYYDMCMDRYADCSNILALASWESADAMLHYNPSTIPNPIITGSCSRWYNECYIILGFYMKVHRIWYWLKHDTFIQLSYYFSPFPTQLGQLFGSTWLWLFGQLVVY